MVMVVLTIFLMGLILGSFDNALVWRLKNKKDWVKARSICPQCKHQLAAKDLVPVLSWLSLGGKCRYCAKKISAQYPLVELITAALFVTSYLLWPMQLNAVGWAALIVWLAGVVIMVALAVYDYKWMILPNIMVAWLYGGAIGFALLRAIQGNAPGQFVLAIVSGGVLFGLFWVLYQVSKGKWIGGGDVKLVFALGVFAGTPFLATAIIFLASLLGTIWALPLLLTKKYSSKTKIPFGPLLLFATFVVVLVGQSLVDFYKKKILFL